MDRPLVSIVTPVYNSAKYITETVKPVQDQTYDHWEMILVDDGSKDESVAIINEMASRDQRVKLLINERNSGPAYSRNRGIEEASGSFLTFIDSDDLWFPEFLSTSIQMCMINNYEFVFSSYQRRDEELKPLLKDFIVPDRVSYRDLLKTCSISCLTAFVDLRRMGKKYMPDIPKRQDWGLWLDFLKEVDYAYGIKQPLAIYRMRENSVSSGKFSLIPHVWKVYRKVEKLNFFYSLYLINCWAFEGFKKYYINTKIK